jgi:hypothetical protein
MFVGDSLSLNQFNSLACMIHSWVPKTRTSFSKESAISTITFQVGGFWIFFEFLFLILLNLMVIKWCLVCICVHANCDFYLIFFFLLLCLSPKLGTLLGICLVWTHVHIFFKSMNLWSILYYFNFCVKQRSVMKRVWWWLFLLPGT